MASKKLYKYRPFNVRTLRLLAEGESYYADPKSFNDPLDCRPVVSVDTDLSTLEKVCYRMIVLARDKEKALACIGEHRHLSSEYGDYKTNAEAAAAYTDSLRREVQGLLYSKLKSLGVLSLAARWNCPLMWSHYADEHRGLCIEYDTIDHHCKNLAPINYSTSGEIKVSVIHEWVIGKSADAKCAIRDAFFYAKAAQWRYEKEWRDVVSAPGATDRPITISAVHFGMCCDSSVRTGVVKLLCGKTIRFYDIYRKDHSFHLKRRRVDVEDIERFGVRDPVLWEFQDLGIAQ
jgi:hypothetical protein